VSVAVATPERRLARPYPVNLILEGRPCLVVGGGSVAARKVEGLLACGAVVHVVAPEIDEEIRGWPEVTFDEREYQQADVAGQRLVIAATNSSAVNRAVFLDCEAEGIWVCGADDPEHCSFTLPSVVRRGSLVLTVSTGGRSPAVSRWLRERLEAMFGPEYEVLLDLVAEQRTAIKAVGGSPTEVDWQKALDSDMLDLIRSGDLDSARERLETCLSS
jgi:precorrin-2 dehydrogenase/sirohydrochlorin ferrochelatase